MPRRTKSQRAPASVSRRRPNRSTNTPDLTVGSCKQTAAPAPAPRPGTKAAQLLALLGRPEGAALADLTAAMGWLPHTVRAALTGLRKKGHAITHERGAGGSGVYRLARTGG